MPIAFTKMHALGNDYLYVDIFTETVPLEMAAWVQTVCDRHTGVGGDGVILIGPSNLAPARMQMWNADGSRGEMCANGLRCVAKYLSDRGRVTGDKFEIETDAGLKTVWIELGEGATKRIKVSLGPPILQAEDIPTLLPGTPPLKVPLKLDSRQIWVTSVSMGNPHCVILVDDPTDEWVLNMGPKIESHPMFPNRTNVGFVQVLSRKEIRLRVWERGTGETLACGSGACAAVVACVLQSQTARQVACHLPGGILHVEWSQEDEHVYLAGPAVEVFQGTWP